MAEQSSRFVDSIPEHYDRGLGPVIFQSFAHDLGERVAALVPTSVLELAAGTGIVTRALRDALPDDTEVLATDLNAPMLDWARQKFAADETVAFETADATALPFDDARFDAVAGAVDRRLGKTLSLQAILITPPHLRTDLPC